MLTAALKALGDLPRLHSVLWRALAVTIAAFAGVWALAVWLIRSFDYASWPWLNETIRWTGAAGAGFLAILLFPASFGVLQSIFLDDVADRVEARHYPELGRARGTAFITGLMSGLRVMILMVAVNLLMLPVYALGFFVAGAGLILFYAVNGWLCGREYHEQVSLRRMNRQDVKAQRRAHRLRLWLAGTIITMAGTVPVLNLIAPVLGCALMVHLARSLRHPDTTIP